MSRFDLFALRWAAKGRN